MVQPFGSRPEDELAWLWITDPRQVAALARPVTLGVLACLMGRERTLSQVARETGLTLRRVHAASLRLLDLGLLRVAYQTPRAGRAIKHYVAVASALYLPFGASSFESLEVALDKADAGFRAQLLAGVAQVAWQLGSQGRGQHGGLRVTGGSGGLLVQAGAPPGQEALMALGAAMSPGTWVFDLWLDQTGAQAMGSELDALRQKYSMRHANSPHGTRRYLLHYALAPAPTR